jgi:hypothetical protein
MKSKSCCYLALRRHKINVRRLSIAFAALALPFCAPLLRAADAPGWMHAVVNAPIPAHDEKTSAVVLYAEDIITVQPNGKIKRTERRAYKILRPSGKDYGTVVADFDQETRITSMHGWCIPAQGKDYEVKDKDAFETALKGVANGELATDERSKILSIPASDPGNIVGYEIEQDLRPYVLQVTWGFQESIPTAEARYTLQLPAGWEYKASFVNHSDVAPVSIGSNQWQWVVKDVPGIRPEDEMPPWDAMGGADGDGSFAFWRKSRSQLSDMEGHEHLGSQANPRTPRSLFRNQAKGGELDRQCAYHAREDAGPGKICAIGHPLRSHRTWHRRVTAASGRRHLRAPLRRL